MNPIPSTPAGIPPRNPFDGLSVQASGAEPLPPGIYIATFVGVEVFTNDKVSDKFKWSWEVVAGQHKGRMATAMTDRRLTPFTHAGRLLGGLIGRPLIPCSAQNKRPLTTHGFKDASLDPARVTEWHARHPDCAWGTPTSAEYGVVDIDPRNGGIESWESLIRQHGPIPECPTVRTGGEGWHHVFQFPTGTRCGKIAQGVDLKAVGGYVIVPPSRVWEPHHSGPYRWIVRPWEVDAPPAPEWLLGSGKPVSGGKAPTLASNTVLGDADIRTHPGCRPLRDGGEGQRPTFLRLAGTALGQGHPPELVREWAEAWAERCDPPFGEWEKHYAGLVAKEKAKTEVGNNFLPPPPVVGPGSAGGGFSASNKQTTNSPYPNRDHPEGELVVCLQGSGNPSPNRVTPAGGMVEGEGNVVVRKPGVGFTCTPDPEADVPSGIRGHHSPDLDHCQAEVQLYTPGQVANSEETPQEEADMDTADDSFKLHPDAYHGPLGGVVKAVSPHTEADDPAVLACLLAAFGNAVGFGPHWHHGKPHGANLFVGLVGPTASRKETATGIAKAVITQADPEWEARVQHEGFDSGEGLIWAVRDAVGEDDPGLEDKRLLVVEEEWAKMFTLGAADKSILTPIIRQAFDRIGIGKPNKGTNAYRCRQPHISIIGNITPDDLRQSLTGKNAVAVANGFMNRFLLVGTRRTKFLPRGGRWREHADPFVPVIRDALETAKGRTLMSLDEEADAAWDGGGLYRRLDDRPEGVPGAITGRAADMVMKLAMVYALADGDDAIRLVHLRAGLAVWRYCEATAFALFGGPTPDAEPEPLWLRLTNTIAQRPGISRSELTVTHRRFGNANAIGETLDKVKANGLAHCRFTQNPNGGPKRECWYPGPGDGGGDGGEPNNILPPPPAVVPGSHGPVNPFAGCVVEGDGSPITGKQTTNPPTGVDPQGGIVVWLPAERGGPGDRDEVKGQEVVRYVRHAAWPRLCRASNTAWPTLLAFSTAWMRRVQNLKQEVTAHHRPRLRASCRPMTRRVKVLLFSRCRKKPGSCVPTASGSGLVLFLKF